MQGIGLGFRRDVANDIINSEFELPEFIEVAPENWMKMGGYWKKQFDRATEKYPLTCHGLSLSIGSVEELDLNFLKDLKEFLDQYNVKIYSEHLSYSKCENAHLYDLLPIPFREDAVKHIVTRIKTVQDILERPLVLENVSYYTAVAAEMPEAEFISSIISESGCQMLLDINNVYVNAFNHNYNTKEFINALPLDSVAYIHMAGHEQIEPDLIIDTHGKDIIDPVFELLDWTIQKINPVPVLLERDFNIPELNALEGELTQLQNITKKHWTPQIHH
ncbi:MAG: HvfB family MNIO-type RiPP peptide maturase [Flavobacteriales bacterium]|tara:strand:- start:3374 stop:4201 length:828 start_codon:yes stop_codon:yes gene_type:complete